MCELIVVITFEPQSVHDSGVQPNHQCQGNKHHHIPHQIITFFQQLVIVRPDIHAELALLLNVFDKEIRNIEY